MGYKLFLLVRRESCFDLVSVRDDHGGLDAGGELIGSEFFSSLLDFALDSCSGFLFPLLVLGEFGLKAVLASEEGIGGGELFASFLKPFIIMSVLFSLFFVYF